MKRRQFNEYRVEGDVAYLLLRPARGPQKDEVVGEAIIDAADLPALIALGYHWGLHNRGYVAYSGVNEGRKRTILLHRHLMTPGPGLVVDHLNRNPLDNRRANLRVCTQSENILNTGVRPHNRLGVKGVTFQKGRYHAWVTLRQQRVFYRACRTLNIARITVSLARLQYQGREYAA